MKSTTTVTSGLISGAWNGTNTTETSSSFKSDDHLKLLDASDKVAITLIPVLLFLGLLSITGVIGNSLVCYVFSKKIRGGSQNFLIICLALFDLLSCVLAIPYEIIDLRFYVYHVFDTDVICKIIKLVITFCTGNSILTLMVIAIDRYRKVCQPLKTQLKLKEIRILLAVVIAISMMLSSPSLVLYGFRTTMSTIVEGATSRDCSTPDDMLDTFYPAAYNGLLFLLLVVFSAALIVMYTKILKEVRRRNKSKNRGIAKDKSTVFYTPSPNSFATDNDDYVSSQSVESPDQNIGQGQSSILRKTPSSEETVIEKTNEADTFRTKKYLEVPKLHLKSRRKAAYQVNSSSKSDTQNLKGHNILNLEQANQLKNLKAMTGKENEEPVTHITFSNDNRKYPPHGSAKSSTMPSFLEPVKDILITVPSQSTKISTKSLQNETVEGINDTITDNIVVLPSVRRSASDVTPEIQRQSAIEGAQNAPMVKGGRKGSVVSKASRSIRRHASDATAIRRPRHKPPITALGYQVVNSTNFIVGAIPLGFKKERSASSKKRQYARNRTTMVAFSVTFVFILSFLPHLSLMVAKQMIWPGFDQKLTGAEFVIYNFFIRSYFINCASNPFIYGVLNLKFRREVKKIFVRLCCWQKS